MMRITAKFGNAVEEKLKELAFDDKFFFLPVLV